MKSCQAVSVSQTIVLKVVLLLFSLSQENSGGRYQQGVLALEDGVSDGAGECYHQFQASRTLLALETTTLADYGGVVLAPGNVLAISFLGISFPEENIAIDEASLFLVPTFHASSSTLLEVAVVVAVEHDTTGGTGGSIKEAPLESLIDTAQKASDLERTVDDWSVANARYTEGSIPWEACRYYEVGQIGDQIRQVISSAIMRGDATIDVEVLVRHRAGPSAFIEGNNQNYANNIVLQIRRGCSWDSPESETPSPSTYASDTAGSETQDGSSNGDLSALERDFFNGRNSGGLDGGRSDGPIRNGQRHRVCGGAYLQDCDLGPYRASDIGDRSCQQHLNTDGCHYDGGDCCSVSCNRDITAGAPYACKGPELDPYSCRDPNYAMDIVYGQGAGGSSHAYRKLQRPVWQACAGHWGCSAALTAAAVVAGAAMATVVG